MILLMDRVQSEGSRHEATKIYKNPFTVWTITRIRAHMAREMGILLSESGVRQIMKEQGLVFKRPKHTLAKKQDKDAFAAVRDILEQAKKKPWNPVLK